MSHLVAPSILSADFAHLSRDAAMINDSVADWFHIDVMDGVFVPNISFGFPVITALKKQTSKPFDVHLMIVQPERYVSAFRNAGADILTVHYEASMHLHRTLQAIKVEGMKAGIAINPHTPVELLEDVIIETDIVCIMSVNPGLGGQKFIEHTYTKVGRLHTLIKRTGSKAMIEVDGGVGLDNARKLVDCGADVLVAGNSVFASPNPTETIFRLKTLA